MSGLKTAVVVLWVVCLMGFLLPGSTLARVGRATFWLLVGVHAIECLVFLPKLRRAGGSLPAHLGKTFVFGVLHVRELPPEPTP